jgi:hypothetical protein
MMNRTTTMTLALAGLALAATGAMADPVYVGQIRFGDSYGSIGGGEHRAIPLSTFTINPLRTGTNFQGGLPSAQRLYETFCLEKYEALNTRSDQPTYKADISDRTLSQNSAYVNGAHGSSSDMLDPMTAYLYFSFINMSLTTSYNYLDEAARIADADALQTAIWFIEDELDAPLIGKASDLYNEASLAVSSGAWTGLGEVRVLNIYTDSPNIARTDYQDVLVVTGNIVGVPLPTGASLAGVALCGLAVRRRR